MQSTYTLHVGGERVYSHGWAPVRRVHSLLRRGVIMLGIAAVSFATTASFAAPRYDGIWSVSIITSKGDCIASYRYPMRIANGILANAGDIVIDVTGKVAPTGAVTVIVSHGDTSAVGSGRLSGSSGHGSWSGASCSGLWTAERRSS